MPLKSGSFSFLPKEEKERCETLCCSPSSLAAHGLSSEEPPCVNLTGKCVCNKALATREKLEVVKDQLGPHPFSQSRVSPSRRLQELCTSPELSKRWAPLLPFRVTHLQLTAAPTLLKRFTSFPPSNIPRITVNASS